MPTANPPLISRLRTAGSMVYTSGVTAAPGDAPTQIRGCFEKLREVLAEAGLTLEDVVKVNVYLVDLTARDAYLNPIWREYFPTNPPSRTTVQVSLGGPLVEVEMVAQKKQ
jgi:2-iminobutanoate/2-iminopropanoate deaminase